MQLLRRSSFVNITYKLMLHKIKMLPVKFQSGIEVLKCRRQIYINTFQAIRNLTDTGTVEPVKLAYATYETTGSTSKAEVQSPPLLILHGLLGSKGNWASLCKAFQLKTNPQRKIIAIDARNHGDSAHDKNHTYAHLILDIKVLLEQLNIKKAALLGHSMGGRTFMLFSLKYPELVDRLIVGDISPITSSPNFNSMPGLFHALEGVNLPSDMSMSQARATVDSQLSKSISNQPLRSFLLTNLVQGENGSYKWRVNIPAVLSNWKNIAKFPLVDNLQYKGPVLFVGGSDSDFLPTKSFQQTDLLQGEKDNFDLSYASYELTESYSKNNPKPIPLLILHGLMGSKNNWNSFCKRLHETNKNKVFALDARNHGDSPHAREHSYDNLVIDLRRFLYKMAIRKVYLLGHSMGGRAVMLFALKYPELVEKLIVADISPITTSTDFKRIMELLSILKKLDLPSGNVSLSEGRKLVGEMLVPLVKSPALRAFLLTNLVQKTDGSFGWRFNIKAIMDNFENISTFPEIHNIMYKGPVLFVGGSKSDYIQKSDYPNILKLFPKAELKYIEGAGHWLHSEKPTEFLNITLEFLNKKITAND